MMTAQFDAVARVVLAILLNGLWQGALIAFVAWLALFVFRGVNASTRYVVWGLALAAIVVIPPILTCVTVYRTGAHAQQPWAAPSTIGRERLPQGSSGSLADTHNATSEKTYVAHGSIQGMTPVEPISEHASRFAVPTIVAAILAGLWAIATLVLLVRLAFAMIALERLKHDSLPLAVDYRDQMPQWEAAHKGHRDVRICVSDAVEVPVAVGLFDAMILLPTHLVQSLDPSEIDQISLHELAHLLRLDDWTNSLQRVACALLFFNPAVWFVARQLDIEREVACDDYVLQLTGAVRPYAFCLTKMAEMTAWPHRPMPAPGVFVTRKNISIRIERLLRTGRAIGSQIAPNVAGTAFVALLAVFLLLRTMTPTIAYTEAMPTTPNIAASRAMTPAASHVASPATTVTASAHQAKHDDALVNSMPAKTIAVVPIAPVASPDVSALSQYRRMLQYKEAELKQAMHASAQQPQRIAQGIAPNVVQSIAPNPTPARVDRRYDCTGCDYSHANLPNKDFSGRSLEGVDFAHANLQGSRFDHAELTGSNFEHADLRNASFAGASMEGCNLAGAQLAGARFEGAHLTGCNIDVRGLSPEQARVVLTSCEGCNFEHASLRGMSLHGVHLEGVSFAYADLRDTDLTGADFTGINFDHAMLNGARIDGTSFTGCSFNNADLRNVDLSKASMTGSSLGSAIMR